jgi:ABC-type enterochelin transport system ATPase subunit
MIQVRNVNKTFSKQQVLFDVSADFEPGKVNLIIWSREICTCQIDGGPS